jgi:hypothetical protein
MFGRDAYNISMLSRRFQVSLWHFLLSLSAVANLLSCSSDQYEHGEISGDSEERVRVLNDSPVLQAALAQALDVNEDYKRGLASTHSDERLATFLESKPGKLYWKLRDDLRGEPGYYVPGQTRFKILFESSVFPYDKVEFESGPWKGRIGWISKDSFYDARTAW